MASKVPQILDPTCEMKAWSSSNDALNIIICPCAFLCAITNGINTMTHRAPPSQAGLACSRGSRACSHGRQTAAARGSYLMICMMLFIPSGSRTGRRRHASYGTSHWKTLRKTCAPLAFSLGRRRIVIPIKKKNIFQLIDLRLPGKRSGGVHVFHSVFQRLPQKHECFEHVLPGQRP